VGRVDSGKAPVGVVVFCLCRAAFERLCGVHPRVRLVAVGRRVEQAPLHHCRGAGLSWLAGLGSNVQSIQSAATRTSLEKTASPGIPNPRAWFAAYVVDRAGGSLGVVDICLYRWAAVGAENWAGCAANPSFNGEEDPFGNKNEIKG
jgi:hypothetical protein